MWTLEVAHVTIAPVVDSSGLVQRDAQKLAFREVREALETHAAQAVTPFGVHDHRLVERKIRGDVRGEGYAEARRTGRGPRAGSGG